MTKGYSGLSRVKYSASRKHTGIGIFRIPQGDELSKEPRQAWINVIMNDRVVDESLRIQIDNHSLYVCEKYFKKEEVELGKYILCISITFVTLTSEISVRAQG